MNSDKAGPIYDAENPPLTDEDFARMRPTRESFEARGVSVPRGRPRVGNAKVAVSLRLDPDVVDGFRATGPGWMTRMNDALRAALADREQQHPMEKQVTPRKGQHAPEVVVSGKRKRLQPDTTIVAAGGRFVVAADKRGGAATVVAASKSQPMRFAARKAGMTTETSKSPKKKEY